MQQLQQRDPRSRGGFAAVEERLFHLWNTFKIFFYLDHFRP
jgi:hypothetical protein